MEKQTKKPIPKKEYEHYLPPLLEKIKPHKHINTKNIEKAFWFAAKAHADIGQRRKSGEPYIMHPVAVAEILLDHHTEEDSVIVALLHDVVEDTPLNLDDIEENFGQEVRFLVGAVTQFTHKTKSKNIQDIQTLRKILISMKQDFRVVYIKIADRIHNLRTLEYIKPKKQQAKALDARNVYVGLARNFNLWSWKNELSDLFLRYLDPYIYKKLDNNIEKTIKQDTYKVEKLLKDIKDILSPIKDDIVKISLVKHSISGVFKILKNNTHPSINHIYFIKIKVNEELNCYKVMGYLHQNFKVFNARFKDYISIPKDNGYKAIHTTVFSKFGLFDMKIQNNSNIIQKEQRDILIDKISLR